jgi:hypothetical protein
VTNFGFGKEPRANEDIICRSWLSDIWLPVQKPFLFLTAEEHASNPASAGIREDVGSQSNSCHVIVAEPIMGVSPMQTGAGKPLLRRESPPDGGAFERARLTSLLTRSLVEEFFAKYLKAAVAPDLDLIVRVHKR